MKLFSILTVGMFSLGASVNAATYKVDPASSTIAWKAEKKLGNGHNGKVAVKEGKVETTAKNEISAMQVTADMKSISNDDLAKDSDSQKKLVRHLSSDDFFKVEKFPTATFVLKSIEKKDGKTIAKGDLTFIGSTHPVEFPVKATVTDKMAAIEGKVIVNRTVWGLKYGSGNFFKELAGDKIIKDDFELDVKITAKK